MALPNSSMAIIQTYDMRPKHDITLLGPPCRHGTNYTVTGPLLDICPQHDSRHGPTLSGPPGRHGIHPMLIWPSYRYRLHVQVVTLGMTPHCQGFPVHLAQL